MAHLPQDGRHECGRHGRAKVEWSHAAESIADGLFTDDGLLDATNRRLIAELQATRVCRWPSSVGGSALSSPAVAERLKRLEETGVITGYRAEVDPRALGYGSAS